MASAGSNFAALLISRLGAGSCFIDAPSGEVVAAAEVRDRIVTFADGLRSAGLHPGDRVLIGCGINAMSAIAYLATLYAGLVAVPVNERGLSDSGKAIVATTGARAVWTGTGKR